MFAVVKNVFGNWAIDESGLNTDEAIELCREIITASHGGDARVVSFETAQELEGRDCTEAEFEAFDIWGNPYKA